MPEKPFVRSKPCPEVGRVCLSNVCLGVQSDFMPKDGIVEHQAGPGFSAGLTEVKWCGRDDVPRAVTEFRERLRLS